MGLSVDFVQFIKFAIGVVVGVLLELLHHLFFLLNATAVVDLLTQSRVVTHLPLPIVAVVRSTCTEYLWPRTSCRTQGKSSQALLLVWLATCLVVDSG